MVGTDDPIAVALKFGFLAVLYLFLVFVARSALRDLRRAGEAGAYEPGLEDPGDERVAPGPDLRASVDPKLVMMAGDGFEPGTVFTLGSGAIIGRAATSDIPIEDPFASSAHARILPRGQFMYIEDMGSTNGTYLNGRKLRSAARLNLADTVRIGDTEYRYEE